MKLMKSAAIFVASAVFSISASASCFQQTQAKDSAYSAYTLALAGGNGPQIMQAYSDYQDALQSLAACMRGESDSIGNP